MTGALAVTAPERTEVAIPSPYRLWLAPDIARESGRHISPIVATVRLAFDERRQAQGAAAANKLSGRTQLSDDPGDTVSAGRFPVDHTDPGHQTGIRGSTDRAIRCCGAPVVVAGPGNLEDLAQPLRAVTALMVGDELEAVHQCVSPAKYLAAFRRMSRSSSSSRTRLRKEAFSSSDELDDDAAAGAADCDPVRCASSVWI
jgi:hypothetical protein